MKITPNFILEITPDENDNKKGRIKKKASIDYDKVLNIIT